MNLFPKLQSFTDSLEISEISETRKKVLQPLIDYIRQKKEKKEIINLTFICTHNSRRSQLALAWAKVFSEVYSVPVKAFSGGTEVTAFHNNAINALERSGLKIERKKGENPEVLVYYSENAEPIKCFSKLYDAEENPKENFTALMTCSEAEKNCPFIPGASLRLPLNYQDPKNFDKNPLADEKYDERNRQIAGEMKYVFSAVN